MVPTRLDLVVLLRARPGVTVAELAEELGLTGMGVRRHLDALAAEGLAESVEPARRGLGRPAAGWRLTATGLELLPRHYEAIALDLLEDLVDHGGVEAVEAVFDRRRDKLAAQYEAELAGTRTTRERVAGLARIRDEAGYMASWSEAAGPAKGVEEFTLSEANCAVHRVAERYPAVCRMELALLRQVMGPDMEVTRTAHTMSGDNECAYCIRPRSRPARGKRSGAG